MKRVLLFVFVCMCQMMVFGQKEYEMVVKKTNGTEVVINVEDIERTFFRERTNSSNPEEVSVIGEWMECTPDGTLKDDATGNEVMHLRFYSNDTADWWTVTQGKVDPHHCSIQYTYTLDGGSGTFTQTVITSDDPSEVGQTITIPFTYKYGILLLGEVYYKRISGNGPFDDETTALEWDHEYVPFVEEGKLWNCNNTDYTDAGVVDFVFTIRGDTLIGENIYKKVLCQYEKYFGDNEQHYYCAVRENKYRVYLVEADTKDEKLIYDFSHPKDMLMLSYNGQKFARMPGTHVNLAYWPSKQLCFPLYDTSGKAIDFDWGWMEGVGTPFGNPFAGGLNIYKTDPLFGIINVVTCIKDGKCLFDFDWLVAPTSNSR